MRTCLLICILVTLCFCSKKPQQQASLFAQDWETLRSVYVPALIAENTWERSKMLNPDQYTEECKEMAEMFAGYSMGNDAIYLMVIDNKGEKWVLNWFRFIVETKGGKEVAFPVNLNARFIDGKIVFQSSMYDQLPLAMALKSEQDGE